MKQSDLTNFNTVSLKIFFVLACLFLVLPNKRLTAQDSWENQDNQLQVQEELLMAFGEKFVELLNTSSEDRALVLGKEVFVESNAERWTKSFRSEYGTVEPGKIRLTIGDEYQTVHVIVKVRKLNEWRNFQIVFGNETPKRSGRINIVLAAKPLTISSGDISDPVVLSEIRAYMEELANDSGLSASLLITKGKEILLEAVHGMANRETGRANTSETPFNLASGGKMFTAVAILKLVQEGKISLNDPIAKYLPDYPNKSFAEQATVAHLLSHSSGLGDYWDDEFEQHWDEIKALKDYLPWVAKQPLRFETPGTGAYSNSGFILLGLIIEQVSGEDYYSYIQRTIFAPLGMHNTGFYHKDQDDVIAVGYLDVSKDLAVRTRGGGKGSSAGGAYSSAPDMLKFSMALLNYKLLNKETLALATSEQAILDSGMAYGYGFTLNDVFSNGFGHGGQGPGAGTAFAIDRESGYRLILLSNKLNGSYSELMFTLKEVLSR